jgi:hypothetical protein
VGIFDWFKNRPAQSGAEGFPDEVVAQAIDKAVALVNPRLKLLDSCDKTLRRPMEKSIAYLRDAISALPPPIPVSEANWAGEPVLRAFFGRASDLPAALGRSRDLRAFFAKYPNADRAFFVLETAYNERQSRAPSLQGEAGRDIAQTVADFSVPDARLCGPGDPEVRRLLGIESFEYLVAQAMTGIAEAREEQRELEDSRKLIHARLRLLQQQGAGLGGLLDALPESSEQRQLENRLLENERQMGERGSARPVLEYELECLRETLENPQKHLRFERRKIRLSTLNVVLREGSADAASDVAFTMAELSGVPQARRAFVMGRLERCEMPQAKLNLTNAERLL